MKPTVKQHMVDIMEKCTVTQDLNELLQSFMDDKAAENGVWSEITMLTHHMLGGASPHIERLAACTELIMLALDIVDDLQDQDQAVKPWMQCPQAYTLNAVLALLMGVVGELGQLQLPPQAFADIGRHVTRAVRGQQKDVNHTVANAEEYLIMVQEKSGSLFRLAFHIGYAPLACNEETVRLLEDLADCIGLVHQIHNDIRDATRFDLKNDLLGKKRTLPFLYLLMIEDDAFAPIQDYYRGTLPSEYILEHKHAYIRLIQDSGCLEYASVIQSVCAQKAEGLFGSLEAASPWKEQFKAVTFESFLQTQASV
ncbi:polyprenyl synthetase family protein [Paenibacillus silvisoli]|uniref:polyprenyl synthetase family protein n=1 Tax=Paenibacillus silvisoli TaxID=3110539 RepID=UPI0028064797|nr:polyprenyl synthetase family protein [Paenibacillus silvisoli]